MSNKLREALAELVAADSAQMPAFDEGLAAQEAWAARRTAAIANAIAALSESKPGQGKIEAALAAPAELRHSKRLVATAPEQCNAETCEQGCACPGDCLAATPSPTQANEPLTDEQITQKARSAGIGVMSLAGAFRTGIKIAEAVHGITATKADRT